MIKKDYKKLARLFQIRGVTVFGINILFIGMLVLALPAEVITSVEYFTGAYILHEKFKLLEIGFYCLLIQTIDYLLAKFLHDDEFFLDLVFSLVNFVCQMVFVIYFLFVGVVNLF